ncbi:MAG: PspC family transcriptional regulator [Brumimicrobium sp.]|nr:PspC family transcriptional regulator [Brumimicrobium sp.]
MRRLIQKIIFFFEMRSFGVSEWWARKLGIRSSKVRLFFIYSSFIALGSPLIIYLGMGWILENKHFFKLSKKKKSIWEL